jgi:hypothetical protein
MPFFSMDSLSRKGSKFVSSVWDKLFSAGKTFRRRLSAMKENQTTATRRDFLNRVLKDATRHSLEVKHSYEEGVRAVDVLADFEDYPIAHTYPRELFEEEAQRMGINIDEVGETEAIRRIMAIQMDREKV